MGNVLGKAPRRGAFSLVLSDWRRCPLGLIFIPLAAQLLAWPSWAGTPSMTEIRYEEREPEQPTYASRILILGERLRMDYGRDDEGFILFDRGENIVWHVAPEGRRLMGIAPSPPEVEWPVTWKLTREVMASGENRLTQVRVNDQRCIEFKNAPILKREAALLRSFRRALAGNHARTWLATPDEYRHPCNLALDVKEAGVEYQEGLLLAARYWDGRSRVYQSHRLTEPRKELFELPAGYERFLVGAQPDKAGIQLKPTLRLKSRGRQPKASQRR